MSYRNSETKSVWICAVFLLVLEVISSSAFADDPLLWVARGMPKAVAEIVREIRVLGSGDFAEVKLVVIRLPNGEEHEVVAKYYRSNEMQRIVDRAKLLPGTFPFQASHDAVTRLLSAPGPHQLHSEWGGFAVPTHDGLQFVTLGEYMDGALSAQLPGLRLETSADFPSRMGRLHQLMLDGTEGLRELRRAGLTHGDIRPENILYREDATGAWRYYLADLDGVQEAGKPWNLRTAEFIPPEQSGLKKIKSAPEADVFALAKSIYQVAFGHSPADPYLNGTSEGQRLLDPIAVSHLRKSFPERLEREIARWGSESAAARFIFRENRRHAVDSSGWHAGIASLEKDVLAIAERKIYSDAKNYRKLIQWMDSQLDGLALNLGNEPVAQKQLKDLRTFLRFGLSREPSARMQAVRFAGSLMARDPVLRICAEPFGELYQRAWSRLFSSPGS